MVRPAHAHRPDYSGYQEHSLEDANPNIHPNDWVRVNNPYHSRCGDCGMITATEKDIFKSPKFPYYSRVRFGDFKEFWINNSFLELVKDNHSAHIPGDD